MTFECFYSPPSYLVVYDDGDRVEGTDADIRAALMPIVPVADELLGVRVRKYFKNYRDFFCGTVESYE